MYVKVCYKTTFEGKKSREKSDVRGKLSQLLGARQINK